MQYLKNYLQKYTSNTVAGSGNQTFFNTQDVKDIQKGRVFYKIFAGGRFNYSIFFTNVIDSTFADGTHSYRNLKLPPYVLHSVKVGVTSYCDENSFKEPSRMIELTFNGESQKTVSSGEVFYTDPVKLSIEKNDYLCLEITFSGQSIAYHEESIIPSFIFDGNSWIKSKLHPFACMIGCDRKADKRIAFIGDSITQGIGVKVNSYEHYTAVVASILGEKYSFWNLGLGYGRANDASTDGIWLNKAKQNDIVCVCVGVNDIQRGRTAEQIKTDLTTIVDILKSNDCKVVLQSVPPFDYCGEKIDIWNSVNDFIRFELCKKTDLFFDCAKYLGKSKEQPYIAPFGGHPNAEGCLIWGNELAKSLIKFLQKI